MGFNANGPFNAMIRGAGNRSRTVQPLPDIGQGTTPPPGTAGPMSSPTPTPAPSSLLPGPMSGGALSPSGGSTQPMATGPTSPMQAPRVQAQTFTMHPPGTPADPNQYNYEPQPDGSWRVYPPGVTAPAHTVSASLPRAASTGDYIRMGRAFTMAAPPPGSQPQPQQVQMMPPPGQQP
jgi:hypothetical protein